MLSSRFFELFTVHLQVSKVQTFIYNLQKVVSSSSNSTKNLILPRPLKAHMLKVIRYDRSQEIGLKRNENERKKKTAKRRKSGKQCEEQSSTRKNI